MGLPAPGALSRPPFMLLPFPHCSVFSAEGGQAPTPKSSSQILTCLNFHLLQELPQG